MRRAARRSYSARSPPTPARQSIGAQCSVVDLDAAGLAHEIDRVVRAWRKCDAYRTPLAALARGLGAESVADLFVRICRDPERMLDELTRFAIWGEPKANTRRTQLAALRSARRELVRRRIPVPELRVLSPEKDQDLEPMLTSQEDLDRGYVELAEEREEETDTRTAATLALAEAGLRTAEIAALPIEAYGWRMVRVEGAIIPLRPELDRLVRRWWDEVLPGPGLAFDVKPRTLQRAIGKVAKRGAPTLSLDGARERAIVNVYVARGAHAAAEFARVNNPAELRRIVVAAGLEWKPDNEPSGPGKGPPRGFEPVCFPN
jgi:hypothetical protein